MVTVVVVPSVSLTVCGGVSTLRSLKVFEPVIINSPVPVPDNQRLLYVFPPPINVFSNDPEPDIRIVEFSE